MRTTLLLAALTLLPAVAFAQAADLLFSARTLTCEWGQGTTANWDDGSQPSLEQASFGAGTIFDAIDTEAGAARIIGNAGSGDVSVVVTPVGLTFIEQAAAGGLNVTTVFTHFVEPENLVVSEYAARIAVTSRHITLIDRPFPSQYHGSCEILQ